MADALDGLVDVPKPVWQQEEFESEAKYHETYVRLVSDLQMESDRKWKPVKRRWLACERKLERTSEAFDPVNKSDISLVQTAIEESVAMLVESMPRPTAKAREPQSEAFAAGLSKAMDQEMDANDFDAEIMPKVAFDMKRFNLGIIKVTWDKDQPGLFGNKGRIKLAKVDPRLCYFDPFATGFYRGQFRYFIVEHPMDLETVRRMYPTKDIEPEEALELNRLEGKDVRSSEIESVSSYNKEFKIGVRDRVMLKECWLESELMESVPSLDEEGYPRRNEDGTIIYKQVKKYPNGRLIIVANKTVVVDMPNPYHGHGQIPYVFFPARITGELLSHGDVRPLLDLEAKLNQLHKDAIRNLRVNMNSPWVIDRHAFDSPKKFNMLTQDPGLILPVASGARVDRMPAGELPNALFGFISYLKSIFDDVLGIQPILRGQLEKGSQLSADAVTQLQASSTARIKLKSRFLESSLKKLGHLMQWNIRQFYQTDKPLQIQVPKPQGGNEMIEWSADAAEAEYSIDIEAGSSLPGAKESGAALMLNLFKEGVVSRPYAIRGMNLPGAEKEIQYIQEREEKLAALGAQAEMDGKNKTGKAGRRALEAGI